jgi:uncharacterized membrane protein
MKFGHFSSRQRVVISLAGMTAVSLVLLLVQIHRSHSAEHAYLVWNLFLAWLPLLLSAVLVRLLATHLWSHWLPVVVTLGWLLLLPNSFYMISDYVHLQDMPANDLLYDIVVFTAFIFTAAALGFASLYTVHSELKHRLGHRLSSLLVAIILFACSFAIYLGRDLRWNSWDILLNPAGILFDVSDRLLHPLGHPGTLSTTLSFFILLGSLYVVGWQLGEATRHEPEL